MPTPTMLHRQRSSACQSGAWFYGKYHTSKRGGAWIVWETGTKELGGFRTVKEAKMAMMREWCCGDAACFNESSGVPCAITKATGKS